MFHLSPQPTFLKKQAASTSDQRDTKPRSMLDQALGSGRKKPDQGGPVKRVTKLTQPITGGDRWLFSFAHVCLA
jgi:hypothetical protein